MLKPMLKLIALLAPTLALAGCGSSGGTIKLYDGPDRPDGEIATLRDAKLVQVIAIDGKPVGSSGGGMFAPQYVGMTLLPRDVFKLPPGDRRIEARMHGEPDGDDVLLDGYNTWTFRHDLQPGRVYSFVLEESSAGDLSGGIPAMVELNDAAAERTRRGDDDPAATRRARKGDWRADDVALTLRPVLTRQIPEPPSAGEGSVVAGRANVGPMHAAGKPVHLVPLVEENTRYFRRLRDEARPIDPPAGSRTTTGEGIGFFAFRDVPPGNYAIVWQGPLGVTTAAKVKVPSQAKLIDNVDVSTAVDEVLFRQDDDAAGDA